jgi:hypothetical protein
MVPATSLVIGSLVALALVQWMLRLALVQWMLRFGLVQCVLTVDL